MIEDYPYFFEPINGQDRKILESMRFPNSYAMMTHLDDEVVECLLAQVGLTKDQLNEPNGTVSGLPFKQLLDINIARHDSPIPYSFDVTREFNISTHGMLGLAVASARNLGEALELLIKFTPLINPGLAASVETNEKCVSICMEYHPAFGKNACAVMLEISMMVVSSQFLSQSQAGVRPVSVQFAHETLFARHYYESVFNCPVNFAGDSNRMDIRCDDLKSPMLFYDKSTAAALLSHLNRELTRYQRKLDPWTSELSEYIRRHLGDQGKLAKESVAAYFNVTVRTLSRKLTNEGNSYQELLENIRCDHAKQALLESDKAISEIAFDLGYQEVQTFSRAFRRWTGRSASEYRAQPIKDVPNS